MILNKTDVDYFLDPPKRGDNSPLFNGAATTTSPADARRHVSMAAANDKASSSNTFRLGGA